MKKILSIIFPLNIFQGIACLLLIGVGFLVVKHIDLTLIGGLLVGFTVAIILNALGVKSIFEYLKRSK